MFIMRLGYKVIMWPSPPSFRPCSVVHVDSFHAGLQPVCIMYIPDETEVVTHHFRYESSFHGKVILHTKDKYITSLLCA